MKHWDIITISEKLNIVRKAERRMEGITNERTDRTEQQKDRKTERKDRTERQDRKTGQKDRSETQDRKT